MTEWSADLVRAALAVAMVALFQGGCGEKSGQRVPDEDPGADEQSVVETVTLYDYAFNPEEVTIPRGGRVTFRNKDPEEHQVAIPALDVERGVDPGEAWTRTFETTGEFAVENPGVDQSMKMTIVVRDG